MSIERILILPDVHLEGNKTPKPYLVTKPFIKDYKPDEIVILGDFLDCSPVSHWLKNKPRKTENKRMLQEYARANEELDFLQKHSKKVTYLEGNHEHFLERYIDEHPTLEGLLELPEHLDLLHRGITWHKINTLYKKGKAYLTHGIYYNKYHAAKHLITFGCCVIYGHSHNAQSHMMNMKMQEPIMAYGLGCLSDHAPDFLNGRPANWLNQFAVLEVNTSTGRFNLYPINITNNRFIWGKEYGL